MRVRVLTATCIVLLALCFAAAAYFLLAVPGPAETIARAEYAYNNMDLRAMGECMNPEEESKIEAYSNLSSAVFGGLTGYELDILDVMRIMPDIAGSFGIEAPSCRLQIISIDYAGGLPGVLGRLLAKEAVVHVHATIDGETSDVDVPMATFGLKGWRMV